MRKQAAHQILDCVKNGIYIEPWRITEALIITGDIGAHEADRSAGMDQTIPRPNYQEWEGPSESLVG